MHHIRNTMPEIKAKISGALSKYLIELQQLGDPMEERSSQVYIYFIISQI